MKYKLKYGPRFNYAPLLKVLIAGLLALMFVLPGAEARSPKRSSAVLPPPPFEVERRENIVTKSKSNQPESEQPESEQPESKRPESKRPESKRPEGKRPEAERPRNERLESERPDGELPPPDLLEHRFQDELAQKAAAGKLPLPQAKPELPQQEQQEQEEQQEQQAQQPQQVEQAAPPKQEIVPPQQAPQPPKQEIVPPQETVQPPKQETAQPPKQEAPQPPKQEANQKVEPETPQSEIQTEIAPLAPAAVMSPADVKSMFTIANPAKQETQKEKAQSPVPQTPPPAVQESAPPPAPTPVAPVVPAPAPEAVVVPQQTPPAVTPVAPPPPAVTPVTPPPPPPASTPVAPPPVVSPPPATPAPPAVGASSQHRGKDITFPLARLVRALALSEPHGTLTGDKPGLNSKKQKNAANRDIFISAEIEKIVAERNSALKIETPRSDIFRFVSAKRSGHTLVYQAAAPDLLSSAEWDGLGLTAIMCRERRLRPLILDGAAAIKVELEIKEPASRYTFVSDAQSCAQVTPPDDGPIPAAPEPDLVALALAAEAKRLEAEGCIKADTTNMPQSCAFGVMPKVSYAWQLQGIKADKKQIFMNFTSSIPVNGNEIRRVIDRTCNKADIYAALKMGVVYKISVKTAEMTEFEISKNACFQKEGRSLLPSETGAQK